MIWRMLDLFSGIGGFSLAGQWCWGDELEIVAFCEIDKFCQKVLRKHWPDVPIIEDVRNVTKEIIFNSISRGCSPTEFDNNEGSQNRSMSPSTTDLCGNGIDLLTGGFPCQPFSVAGKRKGKEDNRFLWPEMFAIIKKIRPRWVVAENVAGIVRMALDDCLSDLEGEDYSTGTVVIPACAVNAPHRRDRVWIVAHADNSETTRQQQYGRKGLLISESIRFSKGSQDVADDSNFRCKDSSRIYSGISGTKTEVKSTKTFGSSWSWSVEPDVGRVAHGVPSRVDRLKSLGNAIVPQIAFMVFKTIKEVES